MVKQDCVVCISVLCVCADGGWLWRGWGKGRRSVVVNTLEFNSEDPRFDLLAEQGEEQFFCPSESTLVQTCAN